MKELIEIQSELKAPKNQYNDFGKYKYRSCEDILEALKPLLNKKNCTLFLSDEVKSIGDYTFIEAKAIIVNSEKESIYTTSQAGLQQKKKGMDIAQIYGASSSYARKYALNGLFLIDDTKDADTAKPSDAKQASATSKKIEKKWFNPGSKPWTAALEKKLTIEVVKSHYKISKENETKYLEQLNK